MNKDLIVITNPKTSSGLGKYIADGFADAGYPTRILDPLSSKWHKLLPVLRSLSFDENVMWRRRWENTIFSSWAWDRNSRHIGRRLDAMRQPGSKVLLVAKDYFPHPDYKEQEYFIFIHTNMRLNLADGKPWVPPERNREAFLQREEALFRHARHIFVGAQYVVDSLTQDYGVLSSRVTIAGGGVHPYFRLHMVEQVPPEPAHTLVFVGWDFEMKGGADLLAAFNLAHAQMPTLKLLIIGPDPQGRPEMAGVNWMGPVQDLAELRDLYRKADLFVMPSLCDSFGFVFLEAMSQGLPCIGTNINAMPEIIQDGVCGYVVPPRDYEALAAAILKYYATPGNRANMGAKAIERVRENYTWDFVINKMKAVLWPAKKEC